MFVIHEGLRGYNSCEQIRDVGKSHSKVYEFIYHFS